MNLMRKTLLSIAATATLACSLAPLAASAQTPSYARPGDETIRGTVASINGKYNISVHDERGYIDDVTLRDGTIINPTGLTLAPGQSVTIAGVARGSTFLANEIDTPYTSYAAYGYPYPVYPYYGYGYGPAVRVGIGFGFRGRGRW